MTEFRFASPVSHVLILGAVAGLLGAPASPTYAVSTHSTAIDITPDGLEAWVVNPDHGSVSVLDVSSNALLAEIPVGRNPWCLDIHPTNGEVWVTSERDDIVVIVDAATRTVVDSIAAGFETFGVAFDPSGTSAMVTATGSDEIFLIDVASRAITDTFSVYRRPRGIAWRPDGLRAWVSHLLQTSYYGRLTEVQVDSTTTSEVMIQQVFGVDQAGYPSAMQNITLAPAPGDSILWMPCNLINSAKGGLSGHLLTPTNTFHAVVRPVNVQTGTDLNWDTYFLSEGGTPNRGFWGGNTPVGAPIAADFLGTKAYVADFFSDDVCILGADLMNPMEYRVFPAGKAPIGIVTHPTNGRVYVANWLSRDVTVYDDGAGSVIATVATTTYEPVNPQILNGKQLFYTSTGRMSFENRNACAGCHVFGRPDGRTWDLSQYGSRKIRGTKDWRGAGYTGPLGWTDSMDEIQDNEWSIRLINGGTGLITGTPNSYLGPPNRGLSQDLDDLSAFIAHEVPRPDTPFQNPDGTLTADADSGRTLFNDPAVGCATCHVPPYYTDSSLMAVPWILHDVGTADSADTNALAGLDTPALAGVWDSGPWLHNQQAKTIDEVLTTFNPADQHGVTSNLSTAQIGFLAEYVMSIGWPDSTGTPVSAPAPSVAAGKALESVFPNPFRLETSLRFRLEKSPSSVRVDVFDVAGRRVRSLLDRTMARGTHIVGWDTRDDAGRPVAPGVYLAHLVVDGERIASRKMTVLR